MKLSDIVLLEMRDGGVLKRAAKIVAAEVGKLCQVDEPESNGSNGMVIMTDGYKGSMRKALNDAISHAQARIKKELGIEVIVNADDPYEIGIVKKQKKVNEEALDSTKAEDLWNDNKDKVSDYRTAFTYLVRPIEGSKPTRYEAFKVVGDKRTPAGKFTAQELSKTLQPIRPNQTPDAEGFTTYVDQDVVQAFQYKGDPIKVMLGDVGQRLNDGDYVIRTNDGNNFVYSIDKAANFEATLTEV